MAIDFTFKYNETKDEVREKLKPYISQENDGFNGMILNFSDKWMWLSFYTEDNSDYFLIKFSRDFTSIEIENFIEILDSLGFQLDDEDE